MRSGRVFVQAKAVLQTYAMRPLMWLACVIVAFGCFPLSRQPRSIHLHDAFPSPFDRTGRGVLRDGQTFLRVATDGTVHPEITMIDFTSMGREISLQNFDLETRTAELRSFSDLHHALA